MKMLRMYTVPEAQPQSNAKFGRWCCDMVKTACANGHLEVIKHLHQYHSSTPFYPFIDAKAANFAAAGGHLEILKWFYEIGHLKYTNMAIDLASYYGHLHVLKWFKATGLEFKYEHAINYAIACERLDILKWFHVSGYKIRYVCSKMRWATVSPAIKNWLIEHNIPLKD